MPEGARILEEGRREIRWGNLTDSRARAVLNSPKPEGADEKLALDLWRKLDRHRRSSAMGEPERVSLGDLEFLLRAHRIDASWWAHLEILISGIEDEWFDMLHERRARDAQTKQVADAKRSVKDITRQRKR